MRLPSDRKSSSSDLDALSVRSRKGELHEDALQHLWAVSYSDLLFVLLSFFIIFFQMENPEKDKSILDKVLLSVQDKTVETDAIRNSGGDTGNGVRTPQAAVGAQVNAKSVIDQIAEDLKGSDISVQPADKGVINLNFADNVYEPFGYVPNRKVKAELNEILKRLSPHKANLKITFIGHTDDAAINSKRKKKNEVISSNLVLSNLRAARAVEHAMANGFDPRFLSAEGAGEFNRNTRSLTMRIVERGAK